MTDDRLLHERYSGGNAEKYDARRSGSARFAAETDAFAVMIDRVRPDAVLDCPFGTGRWLPAYLSLHGQIVGVDRSADMLGLAAEKIPGEQRARFSLLQADVFAHDFTVYRDRNIDLVVCVRFLNWLPLDRAKNVVARLTDVGSPSMIIGASVVPAEASFLYPARRLISWAGAHVLPKRSGRAPSYVHPERALLDCFTGLGWHVDSRLPIFRRGGRENYFYLLDRSPVEVAERQRATDG